MTPEQEKTFDIYLDQGCGNVTQVLAILGLEKTGIEPPAAFPDKYEGWKYGVRHNPNMSDQDKGTNARGIAAVREILRKNA
jgi:hypothetical protein